VGKTTVAINLAAWCVRLDRLGRSLRELLEVVDMLKERRIHFQSIEEKIDTSSGLLAS
jgi:DNA invertase Pin-like site-specific DNA recombinase